MLISHMAALLLLLAGPHAFAPPDPAPSAVQGMTRKELLEMKRAAFEVASADERNRLAIRLLSCLEDPDPEIRDGVGFEGLSTWLRAKALSPATIVALYDSLSRTLAGEKDARGFRLPFAALVLSEVARADRIEPVLSDSARSSLVELAATSLIRVDDYRGFDPVEGWRHGVAPGADLALQLALNPRVGADGLRRLAEAVGRQVAPRGAVFYTFGEPERLARAANFTYRRGLLDAAFWESWFAALSDPKPLTSWDSAFQSVDGLAKRHNTIAFLHAVGFASRAADDEAGRTLAAIADRTAEKIAR